MMKNVLTLLVFLPISLFAQKSNWGNWLIYFGDKKINDHWNWHHEVQYRSFNIIDDTDQLLLRMGIGYNLTKNNNNIHLGCAYIYGEPYISGFDIKTISHEQRIYQQFITRQSFSRISLQHRYRFEQRFMSDKFRLRFRYFLSANVALNHTYMVDRTLYLSLYNEIFANTANNYFDRNRVFVGLGYKASQNFRLEIGIMNQTTSIVSRNQINIITFCNF